MKDYDRKQLWARSGNICSFPDCNIELVPAQHADRVMGEEAHIKGDKPGSPRYDSAQLPTDRESYGNHILLCPNHHTEIDAAPEKWTVDQLLQIKIQHEQQVINNRNHPQLMDALKKIMQEFQPPADFLELKVSDFVEDRSGVIIARVDASNEAGINTHVKVCKGQRVVFFARGLISYDGGHHFTTPEGILCNEYGIPIMTVDANGNNVFVVFPHESAYKTDGEEIGRVGSLFGWINEYSPEKAFSIGCRKELTVIEDGMLYLSVNDAKGTYQDNDGEFRVDIRII